MNKRILELYLNFNFNSRHNLKKKKKELNNRKFGLYLMINTQSILIRKKLVFKLKQIQK